MKLQQIHTTLFVSDLARAEDWYGRLLGRGPDYRPMDTMVQWQLVPGGGLELTTDETFSTGETSWRGALSITVADVAAERSRLSGSGIVLGDDIEGDYSTLAQVRDPDGNLITLATPPDPEYPKG